MVNLIEIFLNSPLKLGVSMADNYAQEKVSFNDGDIIKITLIYGYTGIEKTYNKILYVKVVFPRPADSQRPSVVKESERSNGKPTVEAFITAFTSQFLTEGFCKIQGVNTRWHSIKLTVIKGVEKSTYLKSLKQIFGSASGEVYISQGFLFDLHPKLKGPVSRFYLRGVVEEIKLFDKIGYNNLLIAVTKIEQLFISPLRIPETNMLLIPHINVEGKPSNKKEADRTSDVFSKESSPITAAYGKKLIRFKEKSFKKTI